MKLRLSFQAWILTGTLLAVICTLAFVGVFLEQSLRGKMTDNLRISLLDQCTLIGEVARDRWNEGQSVQETDYLADYLGRKMGIRVTFIRPDGKVLGDSEVPSEAIGTLESHAGRPEVTAALSDGQGWSLRRSSTLGDDLMYVTHLLGTSAEPRLIIRAALSVRQVEEVLSGLQGLILWASLLGVLLSVGVSLLVSFRLSRPVKDLTRTAQGISSGDLDQRLRHYPNHEIGDLGRAFDQMADNLQEEIHAVTRARDRLEAVLRGMVEGVLVTNSAGRVTMINKALGSMLDLRADPVGRMPSEILRSPALIEALQRISPDNPFASVEIRTLGGKPHVLEVDVALLPGEGPRGGVVAVFHDITERKRLEEMRRDFVANVSHELRTPLAAIRASVETLLDGALSDPKFGRQFTEVIKRHTNRLEDIVEDLLELARLESGAITAASPENLRAAGLVESCLNAVSELAAARGVMLDSGLSDDTLVFPGDRRQLENAVVNLLENAVKYTEPGGRVELKVFQDSGQVHIAVRDTGIGIPQEHLPRIFERFYRVDKNRSREMGGTGLGLAIVKHVAQVHHGRVTVDSMPGKGSTFELIIPA